MCPACEGLGFQYGMDEGLLHELLTQSPLDLFFLLCKENATSSAIKIFSKVVLDLGIDPDSPLSFLEEKKLTLFFQGAPSKKTSHFTWKGFTPLLAQYAKSASSNIRHILSLLLKQKTCSRCEGSRLSPLARNVFIEGVSISTLCGKTIEETLDFVKALPPL